MNIVDAINQRGECHLKNILVQIKNAWRSSLFLFSELLLVLVVH